MCSVEELEDRPFAPSEALRADMGQLDGDILIFGAGGKLGPSLTRLALRTVAARVQRWKLCRSALPAWTSDD